MKKMFLFLALLFAVSNNLSGQLENTTFYVINVLGTQVYEQASFDSTVLTSLKLGEKINAIEILKTQHTQKMGNGFGLEGFFIRVEMDSHSGYLFSSDLSLNKLRLVKVYDGIVIPDLLGMEKGKRIKKRMKKYYDKEYEIEEEITEYENAIYTYYAFDGCFNHTYLFRNLTFSEIYHVLTVYQVVIDETEKKIRIPRFIQKKGNEYLFEGGGLTEDLKIIENNGTFIISSYDCT